MPRLDEEQLNELEALVRCLTTVARAASEAIVTRSTCGLVACGLCGGALAFCMEANPGTITYRCSTVACLVGSMTLPGHGPGPADAARNPHGTEEK
jgi:hypothetical protein